jgi:hypothetical protein
MAGEPVEVRLARLETKFDALSERVAENHAAAEAERAEVRNTLAEVLASINQWAGVRSGLLAIGAFMSAVAATAGAAAAYYFHKN